jgi:2-iminobutanoate/2-iminopropanoate deaminase
MATPDGHKRATVNTPDAPAAIGPYSQAVRAGGLLFCSGQIPLHPATGELVGEDAAAQAVQCLANLRAVCRAAGADLSQAVRMTVWLVDLGEFAAVNAVYGEQFTSDPPARVAIEVSALPKGALVEIDAIVALP